MKVILIIPITILMIYTTSSLANNPPEGVSPNQWKKIKQQITASKYYPQVGKNGFYTAQNSKQGWQVQYATDGMTTIRNNDYHIGMKLLSIGTLPLEKVPDIEVKKNTLYYHHSPHIKEWWVNSADKIEQWFGLKTRPITGSHEIKVAIELDTNTTVTQVDNQLVFTANNGQKINYDRLKVWDAHGKVMPSNMQLADSSEHFNLIIDDRLATYPITIDPSFSQQSYLKPAVVDELDQFGSALAISGSYLVVGNVLEDSAATTINGDSSDNSASGSGAAYIFKKDGLDWVQQAYLKASNAETSDQFGASVGISGNTVVVGAAYEDGDINSTASNPNNNESLGGAVYVFTRSGDNWTQQAYLKPHENDGDLFGYSVAIDGSTIVVGSIFEDGDNSSTMEETNENASAAGAAYVFTGFGANWSQQAYLKASNAEAGDRFGYTVAIDDDTIVVSANEESGDASSTINAPNNAAPEAGAAYVFHRDGVNWTQQGYLKAHNAGANDRLGDAVAVDGDTVVIGAYREDGDANSTLEASNNNAFDAGAAYVFFRENNTWSQQAYLKAENAETDDYFAESVDIAGNTIVVGARFEDGDLNSTMMAPNNDATNAGAAYVFSRNGSDWQQKDYLKSDNLDFFDGFGRAVAINLGTILSSATTEDGDANSTAASPNDNAQAAGALYVLSGRYFVGGQVVGLPFGGPLELSRSGAELLTVTNNGSYQFLTDVSGNSPYSVSVSNAPAGYTCSIANAIGSLSYDDITDANVFCSTNSYSVTGTVSGLTGTGLVLRNNGIYDLIINSNGSFTFNSEYADGMPYEVVVQTQPSDSQTCSVTNGNGTISGGDTNISVVCVGAEFDIGGTISGLTGTLVLQNNGGDDLTITSNGDFTFVTPITDGNSYDVSVSIQPSGQMCAVSNSSGTVAGADVTNVQLTCTDNTYFIGGTVSGLAANGLVLQNNGNDDLNINSNGSFVFPQPLIDNSNYAVTVSSQPNNQNCTVINASGTIASNDVVNVGVGCSTDTYIVGVSVVGLTGSGLVMQNNDTDDLSITQNGSTPFNNQLINGSAFNVTISSQPNDSSNTCEIIGTNSGVIAADHVVIPVVCGNDLIYTNGFE